MRDVLSKAQTKALTSRRAFLLGAASVGALAALRAAPGQAGLLGDKLSADELLMFFDTLALMRPPRRGPSVPGWVRKWKEPVVVRPTGRAEPEYRRNLEIVLDEISTFSGIPFHMSERKLRMGNVVVVRFRTHEGMLRWQARGRAVCRASTSGIDGTIHSGRVEVSEDFVDCLRHEFMHTLGFDNHWTGRYATVRMPSVLAPRYAPSRAHAYSAPDETAIRILYDPRLAPGMSRVHALGLARDILDTQFERWYAGAVKRLSKDHG